MKHRTVRWSSEAQSDLADIWQYYRMTVGKETADDMIRRITRAAQLLEQHPLGGRTRDEVRPGLRSITLRPYVIFYRLQDDIPHIVRVIDSRRDIDAVFS